MSEKILSNLEAEINQAKVSKSNLHEVFRDDSGFVYLMNRMDKISDFLFDFQRSERMMTIARALLGKAVVSLHVEYFAKKPYSKAIVEPHQDHTFYNPHFNDELAISLWIPLSDITEKMGALEFCEFVPENLLIHENSASLSVRQKLLDFSNYKYKAMPLKRGDVLAFHSLAIHKSGENSTNRLREGVVFNYRGSPFLEEKRYLK